jgi:hypothetical protein
MLLRRIMLLAALLAPWGAALAQAGVGIKGYDPVSYFTEGRPVRGAPAIHFDFDDTRYLFASEKNRGAFAANPARYEPQFGGYCATGIAFGKKAESDPTQWAIVEGKLYVFSSLEAREMAVKDPMLLKRAHGARGK